MDPPRPSLLDTSPSSIRKTGSLSFKEQGFQFIQVRPAHLEFYAFVFGEDSPPWDECVGNTMVDRDFMPRGFCLAWFRENGTVTIHGYFGEWLKIYPKDILKGMRPVMQCLRKQGVQYVYAVADERVEGSDTLITWFRGEPIGQRVADQGEYYRVDLTRTPI